MNTCMWIYAGNVKFNDVKFTVYIKQSNLYLYMNTCMLIYTSNVKLKDTSNIQYTSNSSQSLNNTRFKQWKSPRKIRTVVWCLEICDSLKRTTVQGILIIIHGLTNPKSFWLISIGVLQSLLVSWLN